VVLGKASDLRLNLLGSAIYNYTPASERFLATTSLGFQFVDQDVNVTNTVGRTLLDGQQNVDQAASIFINQTLTPIRSLACTPRRRSWRWTSACSSPPDSAPTAPA
jgi:hypothetical protein